MSNESEKLSFQEKLDHLVSTLRSEILSGSRRPGSFLQSESTLAKQFQLSNKSVRKGLCELVEEGLIVKIDRVGSMVTQEARQAITINFGYNVSFNVDFLLGDLLAEFHRLYSYIHVRAIPLSFFGHVPAAAEMIGNGLLDVVSFNSAQFQELAEKGEVAGLLEPLDEDAATYPIANEGFQYEGKLYARPVSFSPVVLCYNKDHFKDAGLQEPDSYWTWEDLMQACIKLSEARGKHAIYFMPATENRYAVFLLQSGMKLERGPEGRMHIGSRLAESLRLYSTLVNNHAIFPKYLAGSNDDETIRLFSQERVSIILTTYYNLNAFKSLPISYDISPVPTMRRGDSQKSLLLSIGVAVNARSKEKEAAKRFVEFIGSEAAQRIIRERTISIPSRKHIAELPAGSGLNRPSRYLMYRELLPSFALHKELGLPIESLKAFSKTLKEYWSDMIDEQALHERLERLIADAQA